MQSACRAVLGHCRSFEIVDQNTKQGEYNTMSVSTPVETAASTTAVGVADATMEVSNSASVSEKGSMQMDISRHTERDFVPAEDMHSQEEQEESQLSSQLHETTLSAPGSPPMGDNESTCEDQGAGLEGTMKVGDGAGVGKAEQEMGFLYTSQELARLDKDNMSVILLRTLLSMVRCEG